MVQYKTIIKIIDSYVTKCPTIAEMKERLSLMSYEDVLQQLKEQNLINPLEEREYEYQMANALINLSEQEYGNEEFWQNLKDKGENVMFGYGRRLIEGLKRNEPPIINKNTYTEDKQFDFYEDSIDEEMGEIESKEISSQKQSITNFSEAQVRSMNNYFNGDKYKLNYTIKHEKYKAKLTKEQEKAIKDIDYLIDQSEGLTEDTMLYRGGEWDIHLKPGDHSKGFKGYQSTTFQEGVADYYKDCYDEDNEQYGRWERAMKIKIYAPKGTKGICGNDDRFMNGFTEHEYVLPRYTGFTVLSVDYDNMVAEVLLEE